MWRQKEGRLKEFVSEKIILFSSYQYKIQKFTSKSCINKWLERKKKCKSILHIIKS